MGVQPMMENICSNIGLSKADQSNTRLDDYGNMNVGAFVEKLDREKAARLAEQNLWQKALNDHSQPAGRLSYVLVPHRVAHAPPSCFCLCLSFLHVHAMHLRN